MSRRHELKLYRFPVNAWAIANWYALQDQRHGRFGDCATRAVVAAYVHEDFPDLCPLVFRQPDRADGTPLCAISTDEGDRLWRDLAPCCFHLGFSFTSAPAIERWTRIITGREALR